MFDTTHLEMTDLLSSIDGELGFLETICEETDKCYRVEFDGSIGARYPVSNAYRYVFDSNNRIYDSFVQWDHIDGVRIFLRRFEADGNYKGWTTRIMAATGQHSAFYSSGNFDCPSYCRSSDRILSGAFGEQHVGLPSSSAIWNGATAGTEIPSGAAFLGRAVISFSLADNEVDVRLFNIRQRYDGNDNLEAIYTGPSEFTWVDLPVNGDGSFAISGIENDFANVGIHPTLGYIEGDFYGPNAEEVAGVFTRDSFDADDNWSKSISGAWLAIAAD